MEEFTKKVTVRLNNKGMIVHATNDTRVVLFHLFLGSPKVIQFARGNNSIKKEINFGVDLSLVIKGLKKVLSNDILTMIVNLEKQNITFVIKKSQRTFRFVVKNFDVEDDELEVQNVEKCCEGVISSTCFSDIIRIGKYIQIGIEMNKEMEDEGNNMILFFKAEDEFSKGKVNLENGNDANIKIVGNRKIAYSFSEKYLSTLAKTCKISRRLLIQLPKNENPLTIIYKISNVSNNEGTFKFFVAPFVSLDGESDHESDSDGEITKHSMRDED